MPASEAGGEVVRALVALARVPFLAGVRPACLVPLAEGAREVEVRAGERLADAPGVLRLFPGGFDGAELGPRGAGLAIHAPELWAMLAAVPPPALHPLEDGVALEIPRERVEAALADEFALVLAIVRDLAARLAALELDEVVARRLLAAPEPPVTAEGLDLTARVLAMRPALPFADEHIGSLFELARHATELRADDRHELWRPGDTADRALVVLRGAVRARVDGADLFSAGPRNVVGAFDALGHRPRGFGAYADGQLLALAVPTERLLDVLEDEPGLARSLLRSLAVALLRAWASPSSGSPSSASPSSASPSSGSAV